MNMHSQTITWFNSAPFHANNNVAMKNITRSFWPRHYNDVIMGTIASQITSLTIVYSIVYSDADQTKHQSSASLAFVRGIHRGPVNSPHKWPVTRKMFPFDEVILNFMCHQDVCSILYTKVLHWGICLDNFGKHNLLWPCKTLSEAARKLQSDHVQVNYNAARHPVAEASGNRELQHLQSLVMYCARF